MAEKSTLNEDTFNYVATDQLQDLLLPPEAPAFNTTLWLGIGLLLCLFAFGLWRWQKYRNTTSYLARKSLYALEQQSKKTDQTPQTTAIQCASILCKGLGVKRLDQYQPQDIHAWNTFKNKLNSFCYSESEALDSSLQNGKKKGRCAFSISSLIEEAKEWLHHSRLNNA